MNCRVRFNLSRTVLIDWNGNSGQNLCKVLSLNISSNLHKFVGSEMIICLKHKTKYLLRKSVPQQSDDLTLIRINVIHDVKCSI